MIKSRGVAILSTLLLATMACSTRAPSPVVCEPMDNWPETFDLSGSYTLALTATGGASAGSSIEGDLMLTMVDSPTEPAPGYRNAYLGTSTVDLSVVGALELGSLGSGDPTRPGVLVQVHDSDGARGVLLRFGSEANRTDQQRFDGGYTVLRVNSISENGFGGNWTSGVTRTDAEGSFCAVRK